MDKFSPVQADEPQEVISLFDLVLTLAENFKLLILGPLFIGILVYGLTFFLPQKFQSTAVLRAEAQVASYMTTAIVLDASLAKLGAFKGLSEEEAEEVRIELAKRVVTQVGRNDKLVTLNVTASSPSAAQSLANEILKNTFAGLKPKGAELKRLEHQKTALDQQINELQATSRTVQKLLEDASPTGDHGLLAESIASLSATGIRMQETLLAVEKAMQGLSDEDLLQSPTLPKRPAGRNNGLLAALSAIGGGFLLLVFVLLRHSLVTSNTLELHRYRLEALKRAYGLGR